MISMTYSHHPVSNITMGKRVVFVWFGWFASPKKKRNWHVYECLIHITFFLVDLKEGEFNWKIFVFAIKTFCSVISGDASFPTRQPKILEKSKNRRPQIHTTPKHFQEELANSSPRVAKCHLQNPCFPPRKWTPAVIRGWSSLVKSVLGSMMEWKHDFPIVLVLQTIRCKLNDSNKFMMFFEIQSTGWNDVFLTWNPFRLPWNLKTHRQSIQGFASAKQACTRIQKKIVSRFETRSEKNEWNRKTNGTLGTKNMLKLTVSKSSFVKLLSPFPSK